MFFFRSNRLYIAKKKDNIWLVTSQYNVKHGPILIDWRFLYTLVVTRDPRWSEIFSIGMYTDAVDLNFSLQVDYFRKGGNLYGVYYFFDYTRTVERMINYCLALLNDSHKWVKRFLRFLSS